MTLIVRCPECGTIYKLVPEQIKIAKAWLRCGQCQHAFDSTGLVVAWSETALSDRETADSVDNAERLVIDELLKQEDRSEMAVQTVTAVSAFEETHVTFKPKPLPPLPNEVTPAASNANVHHPSNAVQPQKSPRQTMGKHSWWSKLGVLVLLLALALQSLWIERRTLATVDPSGAKIWDMICRTWACDVSSLQVRDGMVIDNSSLTPREEGGFLLSWSWRNATSKPLQTPALELTLLSAQDKALVRRVLSVAELGAPASLAAGQTWDGQLQLMPEDGLMPSGYRLLSFYP